MYNRGDEVSTAILGGAAAENVKHHLPQAEPATNLAKAKTFEPTMSFAKSPHCLGTACMLLFK